jgi:hypothetical protein
LTAFVTFQSSRQLFTWALAPIIAIDDIIAGQVLGSVYITVTFLAIWIAVISDGTIVAGPSGVALLAHALTVLEIARLLQRTHLVAVAVLAALEVLPAPRVGIAVLALGAVAEWWTDTSTSLLIADLCGAIADAAFCGGKQ